MSFIARRISAAALASVALLASVTGVLAHAALEDSDPAEGGAIATPHVMVARFDDELGADGSSLVVRDASGTVVAEGGVAADDAFTMTVELPALPVGAYVAHWIAITADDNGKTQGDINFTVVAATPSPEPTDPPTPAPTTPPSDQPTASATVAPTPTASPTATPAPTPAPGAGGAAGGELIVPIALAVAVVAALAWFLLRRRPG